MSSKLLVVEPDYEVTPLSRVSWDEYATEKVSYGAWERLARHVGLLTARECAKIYVKRGFRAHYAARMGVKRAAKKVGVDVGIEHGNNYLIVRNLGASRVVGD